MADKRGEGLTYSTVVDAGIYNTGLSVNLCNLMAVLVSC